MTGRVDEVDNERVITDYRHPSVRRRGIVDHRCGLLDLLVRFTGYLGGPRLELSAKNLSQQRRFFNSESMPL